MSTQPTLFQAYAKAVTTKDYTSLKTILHPSFAFNLRPEYLGLPPLNGASAFIDAVEGVFKNIHDLHFEMGEDQVIEVPGRIWVVVSNFSV
jgi:hypothetical protein